MYKIFNDESEEDAPTVIIVTNKETRDAQSSWLTVDTKDYYPL